MWSYCALIVGHDGINSPISIACPATRHRTTLRHDSPEGEQRHPNSMGKIEAAKSKGINFPAVVRSAVRYPLRIIC